MGLGLVVVVVAHCCGGARKEWGRETVSKESFTRLFHLHLLDLDDCPLLEPWSRRWEVEGKT